MGSAAAHSHIPAKTSSLASKASIETYAGAEQTPFGEGNTAIERSELIHDRPGHSGADSAAGREIAQRLDKFDMQVDEFLRRVDSIMATLRSIMNPELHQFPESPPECS